MGGKDQDKIEIVTPNFLKCFEVMIVHQTQWKLSWTNGKNINHTFSKEQTSLSWGGRCKTHFQGLATGRLLNSLRGPGPTLGKKSINKMCSDRKNIHSINQILTSTQETFIFSLRYWMNKPLLLLLLL